MMRARLNETLQRLIRWAPLAQQPTLLARAFGLVHVPMILFCTPQVQILNAERCVVALPANYRTRNHLNSLYLGALAVGADLAAGMLANWHIDQQGGGISLVFKDFQANFLKKAMSRTFFSCEDGEKISSLVIAAKNSNQRMSTTIEVVATTSQDNLDHVVARFNLGLSLKTI